MNMYWDKFKFIFQFWGKNKDKSIVQNMLKNLIDTDFEEVILKTRLEK